MHTIRIQGVQKLLDRILIEVPDIQFVYSVSNNFCIGHSTDLLQIIYAISTCLLDKIIPTFTNFFLFCGYILAVFDFADSPCRYVSQALNCIELPRVSSSLLTGNSLVCTVINLMGTL